MACELNALESVPPTPKKAPVLPCVLIRARIAFRSECVRRRSALPDLDHHNTLPVHLPYLEGSSGYYSPVIRNHRVAHTTLSSVAFIRPRPGQRSVGEILPTVQELPGDPSARDYTRSFSPSPFCI